MSEGNELEFALIELGRDIEFPDPPDLVSAVRVEIARGPARRRLLPDLRRAAYALTAMVALLGGLVVFSPATREAIADFLGISGVELRTPVGPPSPDVTARAPDIGLGDQVSITAVRPFVVFHVRIPTLLGAPDRVYYDSFVPGGKVSLVYENVPGAPGLGDSDIGVVLSQFPGDLQEPFVEKTVRGGETKIDAVEVDGAPGFFIRGGPHEVVYLTDEGIERVDTVRLAGNTLLWERDGVAYRLEADISRAAAVRIGESLE
jgi:hypothetical protein